LSDSKLFNDMEHRAAPLSHAAELLIKLLMSFRVGFRFLEFCMKVIKYWLDTIRPVR